jgi:type VI secretion system protein ImpK
MPVRRRSRPGRRGGGPPPPPPTATLAPVDLKSYQSRNAYPKNPLITAAGTLFDLMIELAATSEHPDVAELQRKVVNEIQQFEQRATAAGCPNDHVLSARYALCSALDEVVLMTSWGGESVWSQRSLLSIFQNETWGGEKVFVLLQKLRQDPARNLDVNELIGLVLALGFEGRFRVLENGRAELTDLRNELYREINRQRSRAPKALSVDWEGVNTGRSLRNVMPLWVVFALTGLTILGMFTLFDIRLNQIKAPALARVNMIAVDGSGS